MTEMIEMNWLFVGSGNYQGSQYASIAFTGLSAYMYGGERYIPIMQLKISDPPEYLCEALGDPDIAQEYLRDRFAHLVEKGWYRPRSITLYRNNRNGELVVGVDGCRQASLELNLYEWAIAMEILPIRLYVEKQMFYANIEGVRYADVCPEHRAVNLGMERSDNNMFLSSGRNVSLEDMSCRAMYQA